MRALGAVQMGIQQPGQKFQRVGLGTGSGFFLLFKPHDLSAFAETLVIRG